MTPLPHRLTVIAMAMVVYATGAFLHEGIGHGGACLATGGRIVAVSSVHCECSAEGIAVTAGGTLANVAVGFLLLAALGWVSPRRVHLRYALWLGMSVNLMQAAGYFLFSGVLGIGDWAVILRLVGGGGLARVGLAAAGAVAYLGVVRLSAARLTAFLPPDRADAIAVSRALTFLPWVAGGVVSCLAGAFNPVGMVLVAISAAAASFGGASGLAWMTSLVGTRWAPLRSGSPPAAMGASRAWMIAGAAAGIVLVAILGPGLPLTF